MQQQRYFFFPLYNVLIVNAPHNAIIFLCPRIARPTSFGVVFLAINLDGHFRGTNSRINGASFPRPEIRFRGNYPPRATYSLIVPATATANFSFFSFVALRCELLNVESLRSPRLSAKIAKTCYHSQFLSFFFPFSVLSPKFCERTRACIGANGLGSVYGCR